MSVPLTKPRLLAAGLIPLVIVFGLACKFYRGPAHAWVNNFGPASVAYVLLFMLLVFLVVPRRTAITRIAVGVGVWTCLVEFLQLWQPTFLVAMRATLPGRLVLGTTFSWWDFPAYFVGCVLGVFLLYRICRWTEKA